MRYLVTFFWVFLLMQMIVYVVGSMIGVGYTFSTGAIMSIPAVLLIFIIPTLLPDEPVEHHQH
ncbi:MAG: YjzD family protein [Bacillus sp. (in: firmicutes)]